MTHKDEMRAKRHTLANALRVAAEDYDASAVKVRLGRDPWLSSLAEKLESQAVEIRYLAEAIEQAEIIYLED